MKTENIKKLESYYSLIQKKLGIVKQTPTNEVKEAKSYKQSDKILYKVLTKTEI